MSIPCAVVFAAGIVNPALRARLVDWTGRVSFVQLAVAAALCGAVAIVLRAREARARSVILAGALAALLAVAAGAHALSSLFLGSRTASSAHGSSRSR